MMGICGVLMLLREEKVGVELEIEKLGDACDIHDCGSSWHWKIVNMEFDRITTSGK